MTLPHVPWSVPCVSAINTYCCIFWDCWTAMLCLVLNSWHLSHRARSMLCQSFLLHQLTSGIEQSGRMKRFKCATSNALLGTLHSICFVFHTSVSSWSLPDLMSPTRASISHRHQYNWHLRIHAMTMQPYCVLRESTCGQICGRGAFRAQRQNEICFTLLT